MHSIWAVAVNTIKQALRMKIALVFIVLLVILLPVMGVSLTGDGTIKGRLQTFISYSLSLTSLLLCLLAIITSVYSVTSDIKQMQIYTVITKPIRRFQIVLGKVLGVILLNVVLLALFCTVVYIIVTFTPGYFKADNAELTRLDNEFFTARARLAPAEADVSREVRDEYDKLEKNGQLPPDVQQSKSAHDKFINWLTNQKKIEKQAVAVSNEMVWKFNDIKPIEPNQSLFVRFKYEVATNPPDLQIYSRWFAGDDRQLPYDVYAFERKDFIRTFYEIEVPGDAVAKDGYLAVGFLNVPLNDTAVIFLPPNGLELLYKAGTFNDNFFRSVLLILFRLIFLACLGILASTFLSFPVAMLFCLVVFFTAGISGFVAESFEFLGQRASVIYNYTIGPIIMLLPQFDKSNPVDYLVPARILDWSLVGQAFGVMIGIKALLLLLLALWIFSQKEIAKITV